MFLRYLHFLFHNLSIRLLPCAFFVVVVGLLVVDHFFGGGIFMVVEILTLFPTRVQIGSPLLCSLVVCVCVFKSSFTL